MKIVVPGAIAAFSIAAVVLAGCSDSSDSSTSGNSASENSTSTSSSAAGAPAGNSAAITTTSATPSVKGITGKVGTIATKSGGRQITVNGWPIYTFASDKAAGDVAGQDVGKVWFVLTPAGKPVMQAAASSDSGY